MANLRPDIAAALPRDRPARVTVVRAGGLGDTILVLPTLQMLAQAGAVELTLVGSAWAERLLPMLPGSVRLVRFDSAALTPLFADGAEEDASGAFGRADLVVTYVPAEDAFTDNVRRLCAGRTVAWPVAPTGGHAAVHFARAVADVAASGELPLPAVKVPRAERAWAAAWLADRFGPEARPIAVQPGSGGRRKCWPAQDFAALAEALQRPVVVVGGPADAEACAELLNLLPADVPTAHAAGLDLCRAAALPAGCACYVGNDSGLTHLASAVGVPTVAVFGPTDPQVWAPLGRDVRTVAGDAPGEWPSVQQVAAATRAAAPSA